MAEKIELTKDERKVLEYLAEADGWQDGFAISCEVLYMPTDEAFSLMHGLYKRGLIDYVQRTGCDLWVRITENGRAAL